MLALKGWNTSKSRRTQTMLLPAESLKLTAVSSLSGSRGLRNRAALMLFVIESHSSSQRPCPNQSMKPTAPRQNKFCVFATTPYRGLSCSRLGLRMKLLLAVLALISAGQLPLIARRPQIGHAPSTPSTIPFMPAHQILSWSSPRQSSERCSRRNGHIRRERSGISITTLGLEPRTDKLASRFASPSKRSRRIWQLSPCHIRTCLTPSARPNGTRRTWYCASENTSAGAFMISSLRRANRCHICTQLRSPNRALQAFQKSADSDQRSVWIMSILTMRGGLLAKTFGIADLAR